MSKYKIALLPGDGIGREVMDAAVFVLKELKLDAEYLNGDIGWEFWKKEGNPLPERTMDILEKTDCALFGAITSKPKDEAAEELNPELKDKGFVYSSPIIKLRQKFDLFANIRPCQSLENKIDLIVFRENTEGLYSGVEFFPIPADLRDFLEKNSPKMLRFKNTKDEDLAISCRIITRSGSQRIVRKAFEYAKDNGYKSVTLVEKPNVLRETSGLIVREARKIAKEYPDIELIETNIDAMCMLLLKNPQRFGVIVSSNMFGDILSDLCAQLVGGIGLIASGNIGKDYAVFEPIHGSAPDIAGKGLANPVGMVLSVKMMLDWLDEKDKAATLEKAVSSVIDEGKVKTKDMGGDNTTMEMAEEIASKLKVKS